MLKFETVPKSRFGFIEGKSFDIKTRIKNPSGGFVKNAIVSIEIRWPNGQIVNIPILIDELKPDQEKSYTITTDALTGGFPLFYAKASVAQDHGREIVKIYRRIGPRKRTELMDSISFHSFYVKSGEEFYSFLALIFAIISSIISAIGLVLVVLL